MQLEGDMKPQVYESTVLQPCTTALTEAH